MSSVTRPRGPLPPRVYWVRRLLVLGLAALLVVGVARLLGASPASSSAEGAESARTVGATLPSSGSSPDSPSGSPAAAPSGQPTSDARPARARRTPAPPPEPSGPCAAEDVLVQPDVSSAVAGSDVQVALVLSTRRTPACTWTVSPRTVVLRLTSGSDRIWSTQDCPAAVPRQDVVLRRDTPTSVAVTWSGQRSDSDCSRTMPWAQPGWYHATAAALGSEPAAQQFELRTPTPATITPAPEPRRKADARTENKKQDGREKQRAEPRQRR